MSAVAAVDDTQRRAVEDLVCDLPGGRPGELAFDKPWEIRAFALAVAAHQAGHYDWARFQGALIEAIKQWESTTPDLADDSWSYYEHWVAALEQVLADAGTLDAGDVATRTEHVLAMPPNRNHHKAILEPIAIDSAQPA
ncbi:nitrile hydratase accessory protein [Gordonia sp. CPCC 205515]|uniref:nitrile hydratase accessory protein n=1 Tax=Gordonia sp. CPCC 205515 TaxID=3140791 RepID=UPI003AF357D6